MMRKLFVFAMVAGLIGMGGFVRDARAGATVDLVFVGKNGGAIAATNTVDANPGDLLTMALVMRNDQTLSAAIFSLNYDLDGNDSLDVASAFQWSGVAISATARFQPVSPVLQPTTPTFVGSFQGFTSQVAPPSKFLPKAGGAFAGGYQMGTVVWQAKAASGSDNILSGILATGVDVFGDAGFNDISSSVLFNGAVINFVPEPGTASLIGLGLVGLVLMGRRNRRS